MREGTGLLRALNFTTTMTSSASTKSVMAAMTHEQKIVEPDDVVHHRRDALLAGRAATVRGWPVAASTAPPAKTVTLVTTNAINRLSTSIVECAPSTRKTALRSGPFLPPTAGLMFGAAPLSTAFCHGRGSLGGAAGRGEIPASQTTIPALPQCA